MTKKKKEECIEWNELQQCIKWAKTSDGELEADFRTCNLKNKDEIADEFRKRLRKGVLIKE